jgi:hypothetical protein
VIGVRFPKVSQTIVAILCVTAFSNPLAAGPLFSTLDGAWHGAGKVKLENGKSESIKCKGYYNAKDGGSVLSMAISCANASVKINMRASLVDAGGSVTGTWEEREFNQAGDVHGKASADRLNLSFAGGISGTLSISTSGAQQTVSISTGGPGFTGVSLQFSKG